MVLVSTHTLKVLMKSRGELTAQLLPEPLPSPSGNAPHCGNEKPLPAFIGRSLQFYHINSSYLHPNPVGHILVYSHFTNEEIEAQPMCRKLELVLTA